MSVEVSLLAKTEAEVSGLIRAHREVAVSGYVTQLLNTQTSNFEPMAAEVLDEICVIVSAQVSTRHAGDEQRQIALVFRNQRGLIMRGWLSPGELPDEERAKTISYRLIKPYRPDFA